MLMPSLNRAKENTRRVICMNNLRQQGLGLFAYALAWPSGGMQRMDAHIFLVNNIDGKY